MKKRFCSVEGCERIHYGKGLCSKHYYRLWKHGSPHAGGKPRQQRGSALKWVQDHLNFDKDECLIWPFSRKEQGYGQVCYHGKTMRAHRLICELVHGSPEDQKMDCAHSCGNGHLGCVNPKHLRWATRKENMQDAIVHGTTIRGQKNPNSILTESDVRKIKQMCRGGRATNQSQMARDLGVSIATINAVLKGRSWSWVDP